jgi:CHASE3 domain sensor protein
MGWIEIVLFYGLAVGVSIWQWLKMDRMLKKTRAEREAREAAEREGEGEGPTGG